MGNVEEEPIIFWGSQLLNMFIQFFEKFKTMTGKVDFLYQTKVSNRLLIANKHNWLKIDKSFNISNYYYLSSIVVQSILYLDVFF